MVTDLVLYPSQEVVLDLSFFLFSVVLQISNSSKLLIVVVVVRLVVVFSAIAFNVDAWVVPVAVVNLSMVVTCGS